ncbi:hypothetical protein [Pseudomonas sp. LS-2]|uniref:hypothetical protein n=1 Tax=Pseudomonas sp. LS-2 TaxID=2315859 RepID=UPI000E716CE7|nr:hypothetical protein [Pseudomonas sp. LS-2]RJX72657.1 hypothetical protein D3M70_31140 [Pseudomonas sp. LS-2]
MSMNNSIRIALAHCLEAKGYPSDNISFSLGYCQGDGASFVGHLDVAALAKRLTPQYARSIWDSLKLDSRLEITRSSACRYVHERSTTLNYDSAGVELTDADVFGGAAQRVAFHSLLKKLEVDIVDTGIELARLGYEILEAYPSERSLLRSFTTRLFRVEVWKYSDEDYDVLEDAETFDDLDKSIQDIREGKIEALGIAVKVVMVDENGEDISTLANCQFGGFTRSTSIVGLCSYSKSLVTEAIAEARETYFKLMQPRLRRVA